MSTYWSIPFLKNILKYCTLHADKNPFQMINSLLVVAVGGPLQGIYICIPNLIIAFLVLYAFLVNRCLFFFLLTIVLSVLINPSAHRSTLHHIFTYMTYWLLTCSRHEHNYMTVQLNNNRSINEEYTLQFSLYLYSVLKYKVYAYEVYKLW